MAVCAALPPGPQAAGSSCGTIQVPIDLICTDWKVLQIEIGVDAAPRQFGERVIKHTAQVPVAIAHSYADALTEKVRIEKCAASEHATSRRVGSVKPKTQGVGIAKHRFDLAVAQCCA